MRDRTKGAFGFRPAAAAAVAAAHIGILQRIITLSVARHGAYKRISAAAAAVYACMRISIYKCARERREERRMARTADDDGDDDDDAAAVLFLSLSGPHMCGGRPAGRGRSRISLA